jgi:hypothetical protein
MKCLFSICCRSKSARGEAGEGRGDNLTTEHRWRLSGSDEDLSRQRERTGQRRPRVSSPPLSAGDLAGGNWSPPPSAAVLLRAQAGQQQQPASFSGRSRGWRPPPSAGERSSSVSVGGSGGRTE